MEDKTTSFIPVYSSFPIDIKHYFSAQGSIHLYERLTASSWREDKLSIYRNNNLSGAVTYLWQRSARTQYLLEVTGAPAEIRKRLEEDRTKFHLSILHAINASDLVKEAIKMNKNFNPADPKSYESIEITTNSNIEVILNPEYVQPITCTSSVTTQRHVEMDKESTSLTFQGKLN